MCSLHKHNKKDREFDNDSFYPIILFGIQTKMLFVALLIGNCTILDIMFFFYFLTITGLTEMLQSGLMLL